MPDLSHFHFLRPERQWRGVIAPHLLAHHKVGAGGRRRVRPLDTVVATLILASIGLAGPTWEREETPFSEDTAPLVLGLQLSQTMDAIDVAPTRLERAKQKIRDVLARRKGARTGLLVYAGTAHVVLPLTDDPSEEAIQAYDEALARRPGWTEAEESQALVASLIPPPEPESDEEQQGDPHYTPDEIKFDEKGKKGQEGEIQQEVLTDEQKAEMWLRRLQVTPADFLRRKFAVQAAEAGE